MSYEYPASRTGDEWRAMAGELAHKAGESFDRCDTDGALSQWGDSHMRALYLACAAWADGTATMPYLVDARTGEPVDEYRWVQGQYGSSVMIGTGATRRWFNPSNAAKGATRLRNDTRKGYRFAQVRTTVRVYLAGSGYALSVAVERVPGAPVTVVESVSNNYSVDY